jgi:hypothetical protein
MINKLQNISYQMQCYGCKCVFSYLYFFISFIVLFALDNYIVCENTFCSSLFAITIVFLMRDFLLKVVNLKKKIVLGVTIAR